MSKSSINAESKEASTSHHTANRNSKIRAFCSAKNSKFSTSGKLQRQTFTTQISAINPSCEELTSTKKSPIIGAKYNCSQSLGGGGFIILLVSDVDGCWNPPLGQFGHTRSLIFELPKPVACGTVRHRPLCVTISAFCKPKCFKTGWMETTDRSHRN